MKVKIKIECSPEEARQFMGLPDVDEANDVYVDAISKAMKGVKNADQLQDYAKQLAPMGQFGLKMFQNFVDGAYNDANNSSEREGDTAKPAKSSKSAK